MVGNVDFSYFEEAPMAARARASSSLLPSDQPLHLAIPRPRSARCRRCACERQVTTLCTWRPCARGDSVRMTGDVCMRAGLAGYGDEREGMDEDMLAGVEAEAAMLSKQLDEELQGLLDGEGDVLTF